MTLIRTFMALPIPTPVQKALIQSVVPIMDSRDKINWVKRENIHITLSYLGDTDPALIETQATELSALVEGYEPFELGTLGSGIFPHANEPRVLWVGAAAFGGRLKELKIELDKILNSHGYGIDNRKFQPHITLGRVKTISRKSSFIHDYLVADIRESIFTIDEVTWFQSTLTSDGAEYREIHKFKLKQGVVE